MTRSPTNTDVDFTPSDRTQNPFQDFNLYLPDSAVFTMPAAGWPVLIFINLTSDWTTSTKGATITGNRERWVDNGIAVCDILVTEVGVNASVPGDGMFWPPSAAEWDTEDTAHHDCQWVIQFLREAASTYSIDPDNVLLYGSGTAAANLAMWTALEVDAASSGDAILMLRESTVPNAVVAIDGPTWYPAMLDSGSNDFLRDSALPQTLASTYADATSAHRISSSPLNRWQTGRSIGIPMWLRVSGALQTTDFSSNLTQHPALTNLITAESDAWHAFVAMKILRDYVGPGVYHSNKSRLSHDSHTAGGDENPSDLTASVTAFMLRALSVAEGAETWDVPYKWAVPVDSSHIGTADQATHLHRRKTQNSIPADGARRQWRLGHDAAFESEITRLLAIKDAASGSALSILFTPPDEPGPVEVRLASDLRIVMGGHNRYSYEATLVETL